jgi:hypothetical protein
MIIHLQIFDKNIKVYKIVDVDVDVNLKYITDEDINMNVAMFAPMELKRINVMVPEDVHEILDEYQKKHGHRSKDKALAELLMEFKKCKGSN